MGAGFRGSAAVYECILFLQSTACRVRGCCGGAPALRLPVQQSAPRAPWRRPVGCAAAAARLLSSCAPRCISAEEDRRLPQISGILPMLRRGIGVHHSGGRAPGRGGLGRRGCLKTCLSTWRPACMLAAGLRCVGDTRRVRGGGCGLRAPLGPPLQQRPLAHPAAAPAAGLPGRRPACRPAHRFSPTAQACCPSSRR